MTLLVTLISWWFIVGGYNLILNTYKDIKTQYIDDKKNIIMLGMTLAFIPIMQFRIWYTLGAIAFTFLIMLWVSKQKNLAEGDTSALNWIILGLVLLSYQLFAIFMISWLALHILYTIVRVYLFKLGEKEALFYYPILCGAFILTGAIWAFIYI